MIILLGSIAAGRQAGMVLEQYESLHPVHTHEASMCMCATPRTHTQNGESLCKSPILPPVTFVLQGHTF